MLLITTTTHCDAITKINPRQQLQYNTHTHHTLSLALSVQNYVARYTGLDAYNPGSIYNT